MINSSSSHMLARFGVIGDVHGRPDFLRLGLEILQSRACDVLLCVGDIADGPGSVDECCHLLNSNGVETVRGNHDRWLAEGRMRRLPYATRLEELSDFSQTYLTTLPPVRYFESPLGILMLSHGLGEDDMWRPPPQGESLSLTDSQLQLLKDVSVVFHGHTHTRGLIQVPQSNTVLVNVGSLQAPEPTVTFIDSVAGFGEHLDVRQSGGKVLERFLLRRR
jgi:predicted phosphodiesterase